MHRPDPGKKRGKCTDNGDEPCHKDRGSSIFFKKTIGPVNRFFSDKGWKPFHKNMNAEIIANPVIRGIPQDRAEDNCDKGPLA